MEINKIVPNIVVILEWTQYNVRMRYAARMYKLRTIDVGHTKDINDSHKLSTTTNIIT